VRLDVVEEVAGGSLPLALGRFAAFHPGVKLEVQTGVSAELIEQLDAGRLDLVIAKRPLGTSKGRLAWREPLVWAAADTFDLIPGAALPLALYRERSVSREAVLAALQDGELTWGDRLHDRRARGGVCGPVMAREMCKARPRSVRRSLMARRGLRKLGPLALDGTKIHADASRHFEHHEAASSPFTFVH
jgi:DNA-binding transcriptional LysR family regulator